MNAIIDPITWLNYLPAVIYLIAVTGLVIVKRVWHPIHPIGLFAGVTARFFLEGPVAMISVMVALSVLVVCVWALSKTISATGVFTLAVAMALLPLNGWPGLAVGLVLALAVSLARTSLDRTKQVATASLLSLGVTPHGVAVPNLGFMPQRSDSANGRSTTLPPYFLVGVLIAAAMEYWAAG